MKRICAIVSVVALIAGIGSIVSAQERNVKLDEIVVTATKTEKELKDITQSVTVITADEIRKSGATNAAEAVRAAVGVTLNDNGDVDGGPTRLISPSFNLADGRPYEIAYARWFYNDNQDVDHLTVEISNNNGGSWVTVESVPHVGTYWVYRTFNVSDYVTPTAQVKVRFSAVDYPNNSITEAGIDALLVAALVCAPPDGLGDVDCDGTLDFEDINPFVLALSNPAAYADAFPGCPLENRDINGDGQCDFADINPFVALFAK